jgi:hypothetical protein
VAAVSRTVGDDNALLARRNESPYELPRVSSFFSVCLLIFSSRLHRDVRMQSLSQALNLGSGAVGQELDPRAIESFLEVKTARTCGGRVTRPRPESDSLCCCRTNYTSTVASGRVNPAQCGESVLSLEMGAPDICHVHRAVPVEDKGERRIRPSLRHSSAASLPC